MWQIFIWLTIAVAPVGAVLTPLDRTALKSAIDLCLDEATWAEVMDHVGTRGETHYGNCPTFSAANGNGVIGDWDVSKVKDMSGLFDCKKEKIRKSLKTGDGFNQDIGKW